MEQSLYGVTHCTVEARCYPMGLPVVLQTEVSLWAIHIGIFCINTFYYCIYKCILLKKHFYNTENIQHIEQSLYGVT